MVLSRSAALIVACAGVWLGAAKRDAPPRIQSPAAQVPAAKAPQSDEQQARAACGGCHTFPPPDILPRRVWRDEFVRMMFIRENRLPPLGPPGTLDRVQLPPDMQAALP